MSNSEMQSRLEFAAFDSKQRSRLAKGKSRIDKILPKALDRFYDVVRKTPQTARFFKDEQHMSGAKAAQTRHWSSITTAQFDDAYYEAVRRIGERHAIIGLEPRWYIGAYAVLLEEIFRGLAGGFGLKRLMPGGSDDIELVIAVLKAALIDMELSVSIYFERTKASQVTVVETLERELSRLSQGDLTANIDADFAPEYATVKTNFNEAVSRLREIITSVNESADAIGTGSREIAQASEDLARRTESNAASLEETSASLTQIDERLKTSAKSGKQTVARADSAITTVKDGRSIADEAVKAMGRVSESAKGIDAVIEGLDKIAFQTRVLAMNAAVEAGRAGEAGRGFAVVADLVSALAMRAEEEAQLARDQLTVTQTDIGTAVEAVQRVDGALAEITEGVGEVHQLLGEMAADNQTQSASVTEISSAISNMDQSTQQNAAMVEQTSAAARNLMSEVTSLSERAAMFKTGDQRSGGAKAKVTVKALPTKASSPLGARKEAYVSPVAALGSGGSASDADWNDF